MCEVVLFNHKIFTRIFLILALGGACAEPKVSTVSLTKDYAGEETPPPEPAPTVKPNPTPVTPPSANVEPQTPEARLTAGVALYTRFCFECHREIDEDNNKRNLDAEKILDSYTLIFPPHVKRPWPTRDEAELIEVALAIRKPEVVIPPAAP